MPRISQINFVLGFSVIFFAASAGAFIATDLAEQFLRGSALEMLQWQPTIERSAHGHSNLFGILHIALGLTIPYSHLSNKFKFWQTSGLALGTFAMGPLMMIRAALGPIDGYDLNGLLIGGCLSAALAAIATHTIGLALKLRRH